VEFLDNTSRLLVRIQRVDFPIDHPMTTQNRDMFRDIAFFDSGEEYKSPVIFSHSLCCSSAMWDRQALALANSNLYRTVRYDLRGHGQTPSTESACTIENLAADVLALADHLEIEQFAFVGSSIGGLIGMELAITNPERLRGLVLSNTAANMSPRERWDKRIEQVRNGEFSKLALSNIERWLPDSFKNREPQISEVLSVQALKTDGKSYASLCAAIREADYRDGIASIRTPVLVTGSTEDVAPVSVAESLSRAIPGSRLRIFQESGHLSSVDQAEEYSAVLLDFLKQAN
jgi:3-oxoadipate enol-lactonase